MVLRAVTRFALPPNHLRDIGSTATTEWSAQAASSSCETEQLHRARDTDYLAGRAELQVEHGRVVEVPSPPPPIQHVRPNALQLRRVSACPSGNIGEPCRAD